MTRTSSTLLRRGAILMAFAVLGFGASDLSAMAKVVDISGTHSKGEIKKDCDAVGGFMVEGNGGKGYGCFNYHKNTLVACTKNGQCQGFVPRKGKRSGNQLGTNAGVSRFAR